MKIIVLHGDDTEKSYQRLAKFIDVAKSRSWEVSYIDESGEGIREALMATSLFGNERFFILKDIGKLGKKDLEWIKKNYEILSGNLILYHEGFINQTILKSLPKESKIEEFKLPVLLWNFLDGLVPGNSEKSVKTMHKIIEKQPVEFVFSLIAKHFRDLYWVLTDAPSTGFPSWKIGKLKAQCSKYTEAQIGEIISSLAAIDVKVKTSKADLTSELDLLILRRLE